MNWFKSAVNNISQPVSEMIRIVESGEGFTLTSFAEYNGPSDVYYLRFGEFNPQFVVSNHGGYDYVTLDWMTKEEKKALISVVYKYVSKQATSAKQRERNRWCEMLGVSQGEQ